MIKILSESYFCIKMTALMHISAIIFSQELHRVNIRNVYHFARFLTAFFLETRLIFRMLFMIYEG